MAFKNGFLTAYLYEVINNLNNDFSDNVDIWRFGVPAKTRRRFSIKSFVKSFFAKKGFLYQRDVLSNLSKAMKFIEPHYSELEIVYNLFDEHYSKDLFVKIIAFRCLGNKKIKLPLNNQDYWNYYVAAEKLVDKSDFIQTNFNDWRLYRAHLEDIGYPIKLYCTIRSIVSQFMLKQYRCDIEEDDVKVEANDYVIDAGAGWGDTSLLFAHEAGRLGSVFSFEFIPSSIEIIKKNLDINPEIKGRIRIINKAVWSESNKTVYYDDNGPASKVTFDPEDELKKQIYTLSIDDFVSENNLNKIDFIKMDIEGTELEALKGALHTLRIFRPKLAIAVYHRLSDFFDIPGFIESLNLGYKFYLRHFSIHSEETILFAKAKKS